MLAVSEADSEAESETGIARRFPCEAFDVLLERAFDAGVFRAFPSPSALGLFDAMESAEVADAVVGVRLGALNGRRPLFCAGRRSEGIVKCGL